MGTSIARQLHSNKTLMLISVCPLIVTIAAVHCHRAHPVRFDFDRRNRAEMVSLLMGYWPPKLIRHCSYRRNQRLSFFCLINLPLMILLEWVAQRLPRTVFAWRPVLCVILKGTSNEWHHDADRALQPQVNFDLVKVVVCRSARGFNI